MTRVTFLTLIISLAAAPAVAQSIRLSLSDAIARGLENSHRIAEARAREEGAKAAATTADLGRKPIVGASGSYTRTNHVTEFSFPQPNGTRLVVYPDLPDNFMSRLSFQWPIFTSGRVDALERAAAAEAQAAGADVEAARADLRLEIVRAYWAAVTAREAERVIEESGARAEQQLIDARQRFDVGLIPPNEVSSLEAQRSLERAQLIEASNIREAALIDLRRLIGAPQDTVIELAEALEEGELSGSGGSRGSKGSSDVPVLVKQALDARPKSQKFQLTLTPTSHDSCHSPFRGKMRGFGFA